MRGISLGVLEQFEQIFVQLIEFQPNLILEVFFMVYSFAYRHTVLNYDPLVQYLPPQSIRFTSG